MNTGHVPNYLKLYKHAFVFIGFLHGLTCILARVYFR
jgi:hypothetical protein